MILFFSQRKEKKKKNNNNGFFISLISANAQVTFMSRRSYRSLYSKVIFNRLKKLKKKDAEWTFY